MSDSLKRVLKVGGIVMVATMLCLGLVLSLAACGKDDTTTTVAEVSTTLAEEVETTLAETETTEAELALDEALIGKWQQESEEGLVTLEFTAEGKMITTIEGSEEIVELDYAVADGAVVASLMGATVAELAYSIDGDTLTIDDPDTGEPGTYERVVE